METFKTHFWQHLNNDIAARDAMEKVPSASRNRIVRLLRLISDPASDGRFRRFAPKLIDELVPSNKKLAGLASRLRAIGNDLEHIGKLPGFILGSNSVLEFAKACSAHAEYLVILRPAYFARSLSYKSFWKCVPTAMICRELVDSEILSFQEVEELVRCGDIAHGRTRTRPKRSVERQYKGFMMYKGRDASPLVREVWPILLQGFLDLLLRTAPIR
jgi:hypothetical protein